MERKKKVGGGGEKGLDEGNLIERKKKQEGWLNEKEDDNLDEGKMYEKNRHKK